MEKKITKEFPGSQHFKQEPEEKLDLDCQTYVLETKYLLLQFLDKPILMRC